MAVQNIILYGERLFDAETYSTNQDPESFSVSLSDSTTLADTGIRDAINKALTEAITAADARIIAVGTKPLSDSSTLTETIAKALTHALSAESVTLADTRTIQAVKRLPEGPVTTAGFPLFGALNYTGSQYGFNANGVYDGTVFLFEAIVRFLATKALTDGLTLTEQRIFRATIALADGMILADTSVRLTQIKGFSDFVLVKDWLELQLQRANIWQSTQAFNFRPSQIHLYGPGVYYGVDFYGSNPSVNWLLEVPNTAEWQTSTQTMGDAPLYADTLYSRSLFGSIPAVGWTNPPSTARQAWTNNNGESHN